MLNDPLSTPPTTDEPCQPSPQSENFLPQFTSQYKLTDMQETFLQEYFENTIKDSFKKFIDIAPQKPLNLRPLHAYLIRTSLIVASALYEKFLEHYYPPVKPEHKAYQQNVYLRELLKSFNKLCKGEIDINHPFYAQIFDLRLTSKNIDSPTKRHIVSSFFKKKVMDLIRDQMDEEDECLIAAKDWLRQKEREETTEVETVTSTFSRSNFGLKNKRRERTAPSETSTSSSSLNRPKARKRLF